jgi:hypothetical protein
MYVRPANELISLERDELRADQLLTHLLALILYIFLSSFRQIGGEILSFRSNYRVSWNFIRC